jgi:hypothetical protein
VSIQGCGLCQPNRDPLTITWLPWCVCNLYIASVQCGRHGRVRYQLESACTTDMCIVSHQHRNRGGTAQCEERRDTQLSLSTCLSLQVCGGTILHTSYPTHLCCAYASCILVIFDGLIAGRSRRCELCTSPRSYVSLKKEIRSYNPLHRHSIHPRTPCLHPSLVYLQPGNIHPH